MVRKIFNTISYFLLCSISFFQIYYIDLEKNTRLFLTIILFIIYSILPIRLLVSFIKEYIYSKFIKKFLEIEEKHYVFLSEFDDTYKAIIIKMEKVIEYKNKNS